MTAAVVVHWISGRIRLRIPEKRRDADYFSSLQARLREAEDVQSVKANADTASVIVQYAGDGQSLTARLRELGLHPLIQNDVPRRRETSIQPIRLTTGRHIDPMFMAGAALAVLGLVQTFRGKINVPSITAFWYALEAFRSSGRNR